MLLHPIIPPDLVNCVIVPAKPTSSLFGTVTVVYKDESSRDKRHPVIQAVLKNAVANIVPGDTEPDTLLQVLNPSHNKLLILFQYNTRFVGALRAPPRSLRLPRTRCILL